MMEAIGLSNDMNIFIYSKFSTILVVKYTLTKGFSTLYTAIHMENLWISKLWIIKIVEKWKVKSVFSCFSIIL